MARQFRLLLVEDDPEDVLLFQRRMPSGYRLMTTTSTDPDLVQAMLEEQDICYIDYRLGIESGLDLVAALRSRGVRVPIVVITGQNIETLGENALLAGATDFVNKDRLTAEEIERVTRWSMIRSRVERLLSTRITPRELQLLMGHQAPARSASDAQALGVPAESMRRVVYISQATRAFSQQEIYTLCTNAAAANARHGITGALVVAGTCFLQVVEGPESALMALVDRLQRDPRHRNIGIIVDEPIWVRSFAEWNMGSFFMDAHLTYTSVNWLRLIHSLQQTLAETGADHEGMGRLIQMLPTLLSNAADRLVPVA